MIKTAAGNNAIKTRSSGSQTKAKADMVRYAAEFGMTPARSRVTATPDDQKQRRPRSPLFLTPPRSTRKR